MSIRHLDSLFDPASVALVGASARAGSVGATVWRNLRDGGFAGPRWAVNPARQAIDGEPCYPDVASLPDTPELAIVATPAAAVPGVVAALAARGTRAAIVLTAGLDAAQKHAMLDAARPRLLRILGPNNLGLLAPHARLNASFAHAGAATGSLAFVSQSGALVTAVLDWARGRGVGFSQVVSLGEHADVDFGDLLDWLASDARTRAVLLYVESIGAARKFMSAARAAARNKPVIVLKAGRSPQGAAAAASHTGALAGADLVYDAAIRRAGMLRVDTLQDLLIAAETLSHAGRAPRGAEAAALERLTIVTNGGGAGVLAADAAARAGVELAPLSAATREALDAQLPPNWSRANPVDIIGDAPAARYVATLRALLADEAAGSVLFLHAPTAIVPSLAIAQALLPLAQDAPQRLVSCWLGDPAVHQARQTFHDAGIATHDTPEQAVHALAMTLTYRRNQAQLMEAPPARAAAVPPALDAVRRRIDAALAAGRQWLDDDAVRAVLTACAIPVVATRVVGPDADAAVAAAQALGWPVALKIVSPQITHKSDVGGVALDLGDAAALRAAVAAMTERVGRLQPAATITGFALQPMVQRSHAVELIVGASLDPLFGPVLLFGAGGTSVEVVADRAVALPPLNAPLAHALVARTRVARLLAGWRDVPAADGDAIAAVLVALSQLLADEPRIVELDLNPLLADADGVVVLDARIRVSATAAGGAARFAIRPYPAELVETVDWQGRRVTLRPIRPEDEAQHLAFLGRLAPEDIRLRIFYSRRHIEPSELARLTQIDYEREMAFVATAPCDPDRPDAGDETLGVVRAACDPDNVGAEFGIVVRSDLKGGGLGRLLLAKLVAYLRAHGTERLVATVLRENAGMRALAERMGFVHDAADDGADTVAIRLPLR